MLNLTLSSQRTAQFFIKQLPGIGKDNDSIDTTMTPLSNTKATDYHSRPATPAMFFAWYTISIVTDVSK
ncbi:hypothetical protein BD289DRAFT_423564 [Coniella lustricola]|uniref:Uncharacterized protein n=1 Tax=Coniella lustricola TaxID=2025994 RepID=A0A2T3AJI5_9PEZI|nr:hypothetical protein BD289DRAFT_423564 [Coniella lustricola]